MQLDWTKVLVDIAEEIAGNLGLERTCIIGAANINWTDKTGKGKGLYLDGRRAMKIYGGTAARCGYKINSEDSNW